jgi:3-methyladenine DNA glycosylase AlkD
VADSDAMIEEIMSDLRSRSDETSRAGMARFGVNVDTALGGTSVPQMRALARKVGRSHDIAAALWATGVHEARILATMVDEPAKVTEGQMESWVLEFRSWDICDQCCTNLFWRTPYAWQKTSEWPLRQEEFVKRAGFVLMAVLAVHDKKADDARFLGLLPEIEREADDQRNFVRKAMNWALRQIGKRNIELNRAAVECAMRIAGQGSRSAKWIAADALRELRSEAVQDRLRARQAPGDHAPSIIRQ